MEVKLSPFVEKLVSICLTERDIFGNGSEKEWMDAVYLRVGDYWAALASEPTYAAWSSYNGRSGVKLGSNGKVISNKNQPWSAAFVSFVMRSAGAGTAFSYSPSHSVYIVKALGEAKKKTSKAGFVARRHRQYKIALGDLIACERQPDINPNYDTYISYVAQKRYEAHCDIVTYVSDTYVVTVGGNVGHSVREKKWLLDKDGFIGNFDPTSSKSSVVCVIENRL